MPHRRTRSRRAFLKTAAAGAAACLLPSTARGKSPVSASTAGVAPHAPAPATGISSPAQAQAAGYPSPASRQEGMLYRTLGRTGLRVSEIALGGSPLPDHDLLRELVDRGVNYIDTSHNYTNGNSERQIGRLLREIGRDAMHVSTKFHVEPRDTERTIIDSVHGSLKRMGTDHVDVLLIHGAEDPAQLDDERTLGAYERLKAEGAWLFRGLSCHVNQDAVVRKAVACGLYDMIQIGYNVFDIPEGSTAEAETYADYLAESGTAALIGLAHNAGLGILAMKTLKVGGRRQDLAKYRTGSTTLYQAMLKWVLSDSRVTAALIEIQNRREMDEDLGAVGAALTGAESVSLARHVRDTGPETCRFCGRCRGVCPAGVDTSGVLRALAYAESYGKAARADDEYARLDAARTGAACRDCGSCERACPFGVRVRGLVRRAATVIARP